MLYVSYRPADENAQPQDVTASACDAKRRPEAPVEAAPEAAHGAAHANAHDHSKLQRGSLGPARPDPAANRRIVNPAEKRACPPGARDGGNSQPQVGGTKRKAQGDAAAEEAAPGPRSQRPRLGGSILIGGHISRPQHSRPLSATAPPCSVLIDG